MEGERENEREEGRRDVASACSTTSFPKLAEAARGDLPPYPLSGACIMECICGVTSLPRRQ